MLPNLLIYKTITTIGEMSANLNLIAEWILVIIANQHI